MGSNALPLSRDTRVAGCHLEEDFKVGAAAGFGLDDMGALHHLACLTQLCIYVDGHNNVRGKNGSPSVLAAPLGAAHCPVSVLP